MKNEEILKAGSIASEIKKWIRPKIKEGMPLLEIAELIEGKIIELGGKPAFPVNLSINEIAAHYTPSYDDDSKAYGLLKVDLGVHIDGWISDTAFSLDLENSPENKKLIEASEKALEEAQNTISKGISTKEIGKVIEKTINSFKSIPIVNLSGHEIGQYDLHAGITIPNTKESKDIEIERGLYAIEPFATLSSGSGKVRDGPPSGIYQLMDNKNIRSPIAREILRYIIEEYQTLPFCSRWLVKRFGTRALIALKQLEENENLHQFSQLIESSNSKVSQSENTILIEENKKTVTTE